MYVRLVYENVLSSISKCGHKQNKKVQESKHSFASKKNELFLIGAHCSLLVPSKFKKYAKKA